MEFPKKILSHQLTTYMYLLTTQYVVINIANFFFYDETSKMDYQKRFINTYYSMNYNINKIPKKYYLLLCRIKSQKCYLVFGFICLAFFLTGVLYVRVIIDAKNHGEKTDGLEFQTLQKGKIMTFQKNE